MEIETQFIDKHHTFFDENNRLEIKLSNLTEEIENVDGIDLKLVSCDGVNFKLTKVE